MAQELAKTAWHCFARRAATGFTAGSTSVSAAPVIIYVPGLLPKPAAEVHRDALLRCLLAGLQQVDTDLAVQLESNTASFEIIP